jgi:hypothetical protein
MSKFKYLMIVISVLTVSAFCIQDTYAKGRSSSSSRSSSRSSSPSKSWGSSKPKASTKSPSKSWGSSKPASKKTATKPSNLSKTKTSVPKTKAEKAKQKTYETNTKKFQAAKASGKQFDTKKDAVAHWKKTNSTKYTSKFTTKPTTRPDYVPQSTRLSNGSNVNITYNQNHGGYGYMNTLGQFMLWDAMTDVVFQNSRMSSYYVGSQPHAPVFVQTRGSVGVISLAIMGGIFMLVIVGIMIIK